MGVLRLLVVEGGVPAPVSSDVREDWVRAPVSDEDLRARVASLRAKAEAHRLPHVDPNGVLRYAGRSITVSRTETDLLECLVRQFGVLVTRETLRECLPDRPGGASRNALDLHIMRVRRRIRPLGLVIRTVWGRGYLLEAADQAPADVDQVRYPAPVRDTDLRVHDGRLHEARLHEARLSMNGNGRLHDRRILDGRMHDARGPAGTAGPVRRGGANPGAGIQPDRRANPHSDHDIDDGRPLVAAEVAALRWAKARRLAAC